MTHGYHLQKYGSLGDANAELPVPRQFSYQCLGITFIRLVASYISPLLSQLVSIRARLEDPAFVNFGIG
jgi:hypothetical protein